MADTEPDSSTLLFQSRISMATRHVDTVNAMADAAAALASLEHDIEHLVALLNQAVWTSTEFRRGYRHKYGGVRWRSVAAHQQIEQRAWRGLRHEHVVERAWVLHVLKRMPERARTILWNIPVAIVTAVEHRTLPTATEYNDLFGWDRYRDLPMVDGLTGQPVDVRELAADMRTKLDPLVNALHDA